MFFDVRIKLVGNIIYIENTRRDIVLKERIKKLIGCLIVSVLVLSLVVPIQTFADAKWSVWSDDEPSEEFARTETRTVYRSRLKEETTSNSSSMVGWTQSKSELVWGNWSNWQDAAVSKSETRQVETQQVQTQAAYTQYRYGRYYSNNCNKGYWRHFCATCAYNMYGGTWYSEYTGWMNSPITDLGTGNVCPHYSYQNPNQKTYKYNGQNWYWQETQTVPAQYKTQYRYKDATRKYYYYRWSDWSDWSTDEMTESDAKEVETKTQYRYAIPEPTTTEATTEVTTEVTTEAPATQVTTTQMITTEMPDKAVNSYVTIGDVQVSEDDGTDDSNVNVSKKVFTKTKKIKKGTRISDIAGNRYVVVNAKKRTLQLVKANVSSSGTAVIPMGLKNKKNKTYKITSIKAKAFKNNKKLKKVVIGNSVKIIGNEAFAGCKKLKTVIMGKNVVTIGAKAFYSNPKLKNVTIKSKKIKKVGKAAFKKHAKNPIMKVPRTKTSAYQKLFKGKM